MPIYTFYCDKCEQTQEVLMPYERAVQNPPECQDCGGDTVLVPSRTNFSLKGSGFYSTDNPKGGGRIK